MTSIELEKAINQSKIILSRSGYTTIMDLSKLEKKAFFIPTPGQYEQEYLANKIDESELVPTCKQDEFNIRMLDRVYSYKGLKHVDNNPDFEDLFSLFKCK